MTRATKPYPWHDPIVASNEPATVTLTVRVHDYVWADERGNGHALAGGRIEALLDESGNTYAIVGLDPGTVSPCPECGRQVYIPDAASEDGARSVPCPYRECGGDLRTGVEFGSRRVEDAPEQWSRCELHRGACLPAEREAATR